MIMLGGAFFQLILLWVVPQNIIADKSWRAANHDGIVHVYHRVEVVDVSRINIESMDFRVDLHLRQRWQHNSLTFPPSLFQEDEPGDTYITTSPDEEQEFLKNLWTPDAYIPNARVTEIATMSSSHSNLIIFKNKTIVYSARLYVVVGCQMQFHWFPMDRQHCELVLESYSYSDERVIFRWENSSEPVISSPGIKLLRYFLRVPLSYTSGTETRFGRSEKFSRVSINFIFERQIGHHLIQVFTPTFLVVALSWFSFWLGLDAVPGRVSLVVTCMLTLVTMYSGLKSDLPPVAYIKMLDIWMAGCMGFVFAAMSEFIAVKYMHWKSQKEEYMIKQKVMSQPTSRKKLKFTTDDQPKDSVASKFSRNEWAVKCMIDDSRNSHYIQPDSIPVLKSKWEIIDRVSMAAFPLTFLLLQCIFWPVLIFGAESQN